MDYYAGNGVCQYLARCSKKDYFFWTSGRIWLLVYGNEAYEPKVLTVASGEKLNKAVTEEEKRAVQTARKITDKTDIPVNFIRFDPQYPAGGVRYWENGMRGLQMITWDELKERFKQYGLHLNDLPAHKSINDKSSSPYHEWQRLHLGSSVTVSDIDLLRLKEGEPAEIIELKRSCIPLEKWEPYPKDYKNFILLSKLAGKRNIDFFIVYNYRKKQPFLDDVSRLKVFDFDCRRQVYCRFLRFCTIQEFAGSTATKES